LKKSRRARLLYCCYSVFKDRFTFSCEGQTAEKSSATRREYTGLRILSQQ